MLDDLDDGCKNCRAIQKQRSDQNGLLWYLDCVSARAVLKPPSFLGRGVWCPGSKGVVGSGLNYGHNELSGLAQLGPYLDRTAGNGVIGWGGERHGGGMALPVFGAPWLRAAWSDRLPCGGRPSRLLVELLEPVRACRARHGRGKAGHKGHVYSGKQSES